MKRMASGGARLSRLRHSFQMGIPREKWGSMGMQWGRTGCHGNQTYQNYGVVAYGLCFPKKIENPHSEVHGNIAHTERDGFFFGRMCSEPELAGKNEQHCAYFSIQTIWNSDSG